MSIVIDIPNEVCVCYLQVTVSDNGVPSLSSTTRVVVQVEDINDQAPVFTERLYRIRIPEMKGAVSQPIYRVVAHDKDIGSNADIDFSIKSGKGNGRFKINPKNGIIYATRDFIAGTEFDLTVSSPPFPTCTHIQLVCFALQDLLCSIGKQKQNENDVISISKLKWIKKAFAFTQRKGFICKVYSFVY